MGSAKAARDRAGRRSIQMSQAPAFRSNRFPIPYSRFPALPL
ncbi:hypothetical protein [Lysobacter gummosus]